MENRIEIESKDAQDAIKNLISALGQLSTALNTSLGSTKNNKLKENANSLYKTTKMISKTVNFGALYLGIKKGAQFMGDMVQANIDMIETNNLFEVSMGKVVDEYGNLDRTASEYYVKALDFQDKMNEKLATNKMELEGYQAMYYNMLTSQGIGNDYSYFMSENLTKAGYDIASLYNLEVDEAMKKLQSGLAGQVKSLRDIGIDVSESSLEKVLDSAGIDRSVQKLSYAEKEVARYIAIVEQAKEAQGDFAKTFEQPANQIRVFKNQFAELKQIAGAFLTNVFGNILVYVNGIIMAIKEILKSFASLFGYDLNLGGSTNLSQAIGLDDVNDGLDTATGKAKEFKNQLMDFDEIHNITLPDSSGGGGSGGGGGAGGIDQKLLDSLKEWDNQMESISGKAQQIRNAILDWLGFTESTEKGLENVSKILDVVKLIGVAIGTWKIASTVTDFIKNMGLFGKGAGAEQKAFNWAVGLTLTITGAVAQFQGTQRILDSGFDAFSLLEMVVGTGAGTLGIANMLKQTKLGKTMNLGKRLELGLGVMLSIQSLQVMADGINTQSIEKQIAGALEAGTGGALIASSLGASGKASLGIGIGITLIATSVEIMADEKQWGDAHYDYWKKQLFGNKEELDMGEWVHAYTNAIGQGALDFMADWQTKIYEGMGILKLSREELKTMETEAKKLANTYKDTIKALNDKTKANEVELESNRKLVSSMETMIDSNGRIKEGYKEKVDYILGELNQALGVELSRDGDIITKNGEVLNSYQELVQSIEEVIQAKKREVEAEVNKEIYKESLKAEIEAENQLNEAYKKKNEAYMEWVRVVKERPWDTWAVLDAISNYEKMDETVKQLQETHKEATENLTQANQRMTEDIVRNTGLVTQEMIDQQEISCEFFRKLATENAKTWEEMYDKADKETRITMLALTDIISEKTPEVISKWTELSRGSYETFEEYMDQAGDANLATILSILEETEGRTDNIEKAWRYLGERGATGYGEEINDLPQETQGKLVANMMAVNGMTDKTKKAYENLSAEGRKAFEKEMDKIPNDAKEPINQMINEVYSNTGNAYNASYELGSNTRQGAEDGGDSNGGAWQIGSWFVEGFIGAITSGNGSAWSAGWNLVKNAIWGGQRAEDSHSPSKETFKLGDYFTEGYILGIKKQEKEVNKVASNLVKGALSQLEDLDMVSNMKVFDDGIKVSAKDASVNATSYVDYGTIDGNITAKSQVVVSDQIAQGIAQAVNDAINNIDVNLEVKADEGIIVKKVTKGFNEYVRQTGELPFTIPV